MLRVKHEHVYITIFMKIIFSLLNPGKCLNLPLVLAYNILSITSNNYTYCNALFNRIDVEPFTCSDLRSMRGSECVGESFARGL